VTVITPVFVDGLPAFWLGSRGHHADIGGRTPGSSPPDSTQIEEEGVVIDLFHLVSQKTLREAEPRALLASGTYPCRSIDQNMADLKAQIAANETGRQGLHKVVAAYGAQVVAAYMGHVQRNAEALVRQIIATLKDEAFSYPMDSGSVIKVRLTIDREAGKVVVKFTGTSGQSAQNYNAPAAVTRAVVLYVFRTLVHKNTLLTEGCLKPIEIIVPHGCLLNPLPPAAVIAGNTEVSQAACNALYGALGVLAAGQGTMNNFVWGNRSFRTMRPTVAAWARGPALTAATLCKAI
jgi:5-oxoprolinase (ATP-hydrolysing)